MSSYVMFAAIPAQAENVIRTFGVSWPQFIAQVVSFCIVAFLLHRFAYKPILQVLEERRNRIAQSLANAERIKKELAETEAARQKVLAEANARANRLIEEARAAAAKVQEAESQRAISEAKRIIEKAQEAMAEERRRLVQEVKKDMARLVVRTTEQVIGKILTLEDQKRLIDETNKQLAA